MEPHAFENPKGFDAPVNILLVDDLRANLVALSGVLAAPGYNLVMVTTGQEALAAIHDHDFAAVVLDVMMPGMDGFECARRMRKSDGGRQVPIIFVTAVADSISFVFHGYDMGAVDYITKPFEPAAIRSKIAVFAELYRMRHQLRLQIEETQRLRQKLQCQAAKDAGRGAAEPDASAVGSTG